MNIIIFSLIILTVIFNAAAQIALKMGMTKIGVFSFTWNNFIPIILKVIASPWIIIGLTTYVVSVFVWLMVLSRTPVSIACPISSIGYIATAITAYYLWGEDLTPIRIIGIFVIIIGVYLVAKN